MPLLPSISEPFKTQSVRISAFYKNAIESQSASANRDQLLKYAGRSPERSGLREVFPESIRIDVNFRE